MDHDKLWKILRDGNTRPPYLPPEKPVCRSRSNRTRHRMTNWLKTGKGVHKGFILSPCLFNFYAEYIMWNAGLDEAQAGIKIVGRKINNLRYADYTTQGQNVKRNYRAFWWKWKVKVKSLSVSDSLRPHGLLIFLPAILIPACTSSSLAFCMMYFAYKLNKEDDNIQPCHPWEIYSFPNFEPEYHLMWLRG